MSNIGEQEIQTEWLIPPELRSKQKKNLTDPRAEYPGPKLDEYVREMTTILATKTTSKAAVLREIEADVRVSGMPLKHIISRFHNAEIPKPPFLDRKSALHRRICKNMRSNRETLLVVASDPTYAMDINDWNNFFYRFEYSEFLASSSPRRRSLEELPRRRSLEELPRIAKVPKIARLFYELEVQVRHTSCVLYYNASPVHIKSPPCPDGFGESCTTLFLIFLAFLRAKGCAPVRILFVGEFARKMNKERLHHIADAKEIEYIGGQNAIYRVERQLDHINEARKFFGLEVADVLPPYFPSNSGQANVREGNRNCSDGHYTPKSIGAYESEENVESSNTTGQTEGHSEAVSDDEHSGDSTDSESESQTDSRAYLIFFKRKPDDENFQTHVFVHTCQENSDEGCQYFQGVQESYRKLESCLIHSKACMIWNIDELGLPPREACGRILGPKIQEPAKVPTLLVSRERASVDLLRETGDQTFLLLVDSSPLEEIAHLFLQSRKVYRTALRNEHITLTSMGFS